VGPPGPAADRLCRPLVGLPGYRLRIDLTRASPPTTVKFIGGGRLSELVQQQGIGMKSVPTVFDDGFDRFDSIAGTPRPATTAHCPTPSIPSLCRGGRRVERPL